MITTKEILDKLESYKNRTLTQEELNEGYTHIPQLDLIDKVKSFIDYMILDNKDNYLHYIYCGKQGEIIVELKKNDIEIDIEFHSTNNNDNTLTIYKLPNYEVIYDSMFFISLINKYLK